MLSSSPQGEEHGHKSEKDDKSASHSQALQPGKQPSSGDGRSVEYRLEPGSEGSGDRTDSGKPEAFEEGGEEGKRHAGGFFVRLGWW
jgi:hypothetical protein